MKLKKYLLTDQDMALEKEVINIEISEDSSRKKRPFRFSQSFLTPLLKNLKKIRN